MYQIKEFKTAAAMQNWIDKHGKNYQYTEVFINNAYGLEIKKGNYILVNTARFLKC